MAKRGTAPGYRYEGYADAMAAKNAFDLKLKRALLEEHGVPTFVASDFANEIFGLSHSPFVARKGPDPFTIMVPEGRLEEARAILSGAVQREAEPALVFLDWQHRVLTLGGELPRGSDGMDLSDFSFLGQAETGEGSWAFFLTERDGASFALEPQGAFQAMDKAVRRFEGLQAAYAAVLLDGFDPGPSFYEVFGFCGEARGATDLGKLVLAGKKTGTASLLWDYEEEGGAPARVGAVSIVVDGRGRPLCAIETTSVEILPFGEVGPEHAAAEGEGDLSLAYWRKVHRRFFGKGREGKRPFVETAPVVCERFRILRRFA